MQMSMVGPATVIYMYTVANAMKRLLWEQWDSGTATRASECPACLPSKGILHDWGWREARTETRRLDDQGGEGTMGDGLAAGPGSPTYGRRPRTESYSTCRRVDKVTAKRYLYSVGWPSNARLRDESQRVFLLLACHDFYQGRREMRLAATIIHTVAFGDRRGECHGKALVSTRRAADEEITNHALFGLCRCEGLRRRTGGAHLLLWVGGVTMRGLPHIISLDIPRYHLISGSRPPRDERGTYSINTFSARCRRSMERAISWVSTRAVKSYVTNDGRRSDHLRRHLRLCPQPPGHEIKPSKRQFQQCYRFAAQRHDCL
ncbi:hypothetical protein K504DRAFT_279515 [Pleomassaria siparia CBS 279.74]|uniref:Uncharacterized protein n=1 Tax=Pleomassaria siparia CBS 279.74 TaxID=1314801 RepID=A0A6G1KBC8_9PLEO|nr:hypothetical protein K504DRAFT_279515 [Pleomassaria siparia CBS 279.74]